MSRLSVVILMLFALVCVGAAALDVLDAGRCGPLFDHKHCADHSNGAKTAALSPLWCNELDGTCGTTAVHKSLGAESVYSFSPKYTIHTTGTTMQSGMFPYLLGGGSKNVQPSAQACMDQVSYQCCWFAQKS